MARARCLLFLCFALLCPGGPAAAAPEAAEIDALVEESLRAWRVPGAAVAVVRGDEVAYLKGFGVREVEKEGAVTPDTVFAIASLTKAFTTTAMAMLVDEGKMGWDDPVRKHLPAFRLADPLADGNVTLRDLVTHRTGLARHDMLWLGTRWTPEEIVRRIGSVPLDRPYRSGYGYHNIMFMAAGCAVGAASGDSWEAFMQRRIFAPLGMREAGCRREGDARPAAHAAGHTGSFDTPARALDWRDYDNVAAAGAINASVRDLTRWVRLHLGEGVFEGRRLVSAKNLRETHTPQVVMPMSDAFRALNPETVQLSYAMGWMVQDYHGRPLVFHTGNLGGCTGRVTLLPKQKVGIVVMANRSNTGLNQAVTKTIVDRLLDLPPRDWNALLLEQERKDRAESAARRKERGAKRQAETKPSRELAAYAGAYEDTAYGTARVTLENGALVLEWGTARARLDHHPFATFTARQGLLDDETIPFVLNADGEVAGLRLFGVEFRRAKEVQ